MRDINYPVIMTYGNDAVVLGIARSLGVKNIPVKLINWYKFTPANYSKYVEPIIFPNPREYEKDFVLSLLSYGKSMCKEYGRRLLLLPTADDALLIIANNYKELIKYFIILGDPTEKEGFKKFMRKDYFFEMVKKAREELIGKTDYDFFPKNEADFFTQKDREITQNKKLLDILEETIENKNLGQRILHTKKIPIFNKEGNPQFS